MRAPVFVIVNTLLVSLKCYFSLVKMKVTQSCPTLCNPMDYTVHGILQARILEWVAYPFSTGSSQPRNRTGVSCTVGRFFTDLVELSGKPLEDFKLVVFTK